MLELTVTPNRAGLTLWGDYECLKRLHEFIHRLTEKSGYIGTKDGFVLGLAYDVRKAFQGQRSQDTYTCNDTDHYRLYGVEILLPLILVQSVILREAMAFTPTSKLDQAIMFELEHAIESALMKAAPQAFNDIMAAMECVENAPYAHLEAIIDGRCRYFVEIPPKERLQALPKLLETFDPAYEVLMGVRGSLMPDAIPLSAFVNGREEEEWPDFRW